MGVAFSALNRTRGQVLDSRDCKMRAGVITHLPSLVPCTYYMEFGNIPLQPFNATSIKDESSRFLLEYQF